LHLDIRRSYRRRRLDEARSLDGVSGNEKGSVSTPERFCSGWPE
jgi:hypothetical protein